MVNVLCVIVVEALSIFELCVTFESCNSGGPDRAQCYEIRGTTTTGLLSGGIGNLLAKGGNIVGGMVQMGVEGKMIGAC